MAKKNLTKVYCWLSKKRFFFKSLNYEICSRSYSEICYADSWNFSIIVKFTHLVVQISHKDFEFYKVSNFTITTSNYTSNSSNYKVSKTLIKLDILTYYSLWKGLESYIYIIIWYSKLCCDQRIPNTDKRISVKL